MIYDLVFEGGGAKGFVLVGACEEFLRRGHTPGRVLGTSAGAITAALVAAGYTPEEMIAALNERDAAGHSVMSSFLGEPPAFADAEVRASTIRKLLKDVNAVPIPDFIEDKVDDYLAGFLANNLMSRHLFAFVERGGWYSAHNFLTWLRAKLDSGQRAGAPRKFSGMTLQEFFTATGVELAVVVSDTTAGRMLVLNHRTAPACPLVMAVRMSMSIPLLWDEVIWKEEWGGYRDIPAKTMAGHAIVDGGMLSNFPIELFLSDDLNVINVMGPKQATPVLGMLIDEDMEVPPLPQPEAAILLDTSNVHLNELATVKRIRALAATALGAHDKSVMDEYPQLIVRLPAKDYGVVEFDLPSHRLEALLNGGRVAMAGYFDQPLPAAIEAGMEATPITPSSAVIDRRARDILGM